jgi:hypothetical protein
MSIGPDVDECLHKPPSFLVELDLDILPVSPGVLELHRGRAAGREPQRLRVGQPRKPHLDSILEFRIVEREFD